MKVLVFTYSDRFASPALFADTAALVGAFDEDYEDLLAKGCAEAMDHPGEAVEVGDGDQITYMTVQGTEKG